MSRGWGKSKVSEGEMSIRRSREGGMYVRRSGGVRVKDEKEATSGSVRQGAQAGPTRPEYGIGTL